MNVLKSEIDNNFLLSQSVLLRDSIYQRKILIFGVSILIKFEVYFKNTEFYHQLIDDLGYLLKQDEIQYNNIYHHNLAHISVLFEKILEQADNRALIYSDSNFNLNLLKTDIINYLSTYGPYIPYHEIPFQISPIQAETFLDQSLLQLIPRSLKIIDFVREIPNYQVERIVLRLKEWQLNKKLILVDQLEPTNQYEYTPVDNLQVDQRILQLFNTSQPQLLNLYQQLA